MSKELILVLGGARGGKSAYAQELAAERGGDEVVFLATAQALDDEMQARIQKHQADRPATWTTVEAPSLLEGGWEEAVSGARVVLLDCLTLLTSNALLRAHSAICDLGNSGPECGEAAAALGEKAQAEVELELDALLGAVAASTATWIIVSNEVGLGLVPDNPLGRVYRDVLGGANREVAAAADGVLLLVAGIPLRLK